MNKTLAAPFMVEESPLELSLSLTREGLQAVDALILEIVTHEIPIIKNIAGHIVASGGKRLRPMLTLLSTQALGYCGDRQVRQAAAVEFMHTATLLHDDVVDVSKLRRGNPTANEVWGNKASVLVGDFLLGQAFRLMVADGSLEVLDILSQAASTISKGEVLQLSTERNLATTQEIYTDIIVAKTAALFAAACEIAPVIAGKPQFREAFSTYGNALGIAFQMMDDLLDYSASQTVLGKRLGDDFREHKVTLPVIFAYQRASADEKQFWERIFTADETPDDEAFLHACVLFKKHRVEDAMIEQINKYCATACSALVDIPQCTAKQALLDIVEYSRRRGY